MAFSTALFLFCMSGGNDGAGTANPTLSGGNGGGFDTGVPGMVSDAFIWNANTTSPVISSASYAFISRDINAKLFINSGATTYSGWYNINSVAASAATLAASPSGATLLDGSLSSYTGCASASTVTNVKWSVDYSQQPNPVFIYKDIVTDSANLSGFSSAQFPFTNNLIGNLVCISACGANGLGLRNQRVAICSISAGFLAIADKTLGASGATGISGACGGALASPGMASAICAGLPIAQAAKGATVFIKNGLYLVTSATASIPKGRFLSAGTGAAPMIVRGYDITPGDETALANRPTIRYGVNGGSAALLDSAASTVTIVENLVVDGAGLQFTSTRGITTSNVDFAIRRVKVINCSAVGINIAGGLNTIIDTEVANCSGSVAITIVGQTFLDGCYVHDNAIDGLTTSTRATIVNSIFANNKSAATKSAIICTGVGGSIVLLNSVVYGSGSHGVDMQLATQVGRITSINSIFENNGGYGINVVWATNQQMINLMNNGFFNNTSGNYDMSHTPNRYVIGNFNALGSFFTNAAGGDFSLNTLVNRGQLGIARGFPANIVGTNTLIYDDVGVAQHPTRGVSYGNIS